MFYWQDNFFIMFTSLIVVIGSGSVLLILFYQGFRTRSITKLSGLLLGSMSGFFMTYFTWAFRAAVFPSEASIESIWFIWMITYSFGVVGVYFLAAWGMELIGEQSRSSLLLGLLALPGILVIILLIVFRSPSDIHRLDLMVKYGGITDVNTAGAMTDPISIIILLVILFYLIIPILFITHYLFFLEDEKNPIVKRKLTVIYVGLLALAVGTTLDGSKLIPDTTLLGIEGFLILPVRMLMAIGMLIIALGFKLPKKWLPSM